MADTKDSKKVIKVASVATPRAVTPKDGPETQVLEFIGEDKLRYEAWGPELAEVITKGAELIADITHTTRQTQEGPVDVHRVTQIYIDGKQVRPAQRRSGGGGGAARSPEDRASIESQVAAYVTKDLYIADKIGDDDPLVKDLKAWVGPRLKRAITQPAAEKPVPQTKTEPKETKQPVKLKEEEPKITKDQTLMLIKAVKDQGYESANVTTIIVRKFNKGSSQELTQKEAHELIAMLERGEGKVTEDDIPF